MIEHGRHRLPITHAFFPGEIGGLERDVGETVADLLFVEGAELIAVACDVPVHDVEIRG